MTWRELHTQITHLMATDPAFADTEIAGVWHTYGGKIMREVDNIEWESDRNRAEAIAEDPSLLTPMMVLSPFDGLSNIDIALSTDETAVYGDWYLVVESGP